MRQTRKQYPICGMIAALFILAAGLQAAPDDFTRSTIDLGVVVQNMQKSADFYTKALGFTEVGGFSVPAQMGGTSGLTDYEGFKVRMFVLDGLKTATHLKLIQLPAKEIDNSFINSSYGYSYLTIFVKNTGKALQRAARYGVKPVKKTLDLGGGTKLTLVKDPDGNIIELLETPHGPYSVHGFERSWNGRKEPPMVTPATVCGDPPSDAIVLLGKNATNLDEWKADKPGPVKWKLVPAHNGQPAYMEVTKKAGSIHTAREFGSYQLHIEWRTPEIPKGHSQERGNSGIFFMGRYELQVLDSYHNPTYPDGQAGAIYGQAPPIKNASKGPGQWQVYDVSFLAPIFNKKTGLLERPGRITVFHNGVVIHNNYIIRGVTFHKRVTSYYPMPNKDNPNVGPLGLQDHGNPIRYRNIWVRPLPDDEIPSTEPYIKKPGEK